MVAGHSPLIRRVPRHLPPKGEGFPSMGEICRKNGKIGVSVRWTNNGGCDIIHIYKITPLKEEILW